MNRIYNTLRVALPCLLLSATAAAQRHSFTINGKIGELASPAKAYLSYEGLDGFQDDSAVISNGRFSLSGEVLRLRRARLWINPAGNGRGRGWGPIDLYLEATPISIQSEDSLKRLVVSGGPVITDLVAYQKAVQAADLQTPGKKEVPKEEQAKAQYYDALKKKDKAIALQFISQHTDSDYSLLLLQEQAGMTPDTKETEAVFNTLSARVRATPAGIAYATLLNEMKVRDAGTVAPDFTLPDTAGRAVSLHDFKGHYVFLDFWASWCTPCRAEHPNLVKMYADYKDKGVNFISVSIDEAKDSIKWIDAIRADHLTWTQLSGLTGWEQNEVAKQYQVKWVPMNYLIDPAGKIVARNLRGYELQNKLAELAGARKADTSGTLKEGEEGYLLKVNDKAADFTAEMLNGKQIRLSDLKGKVVLLNFWATWCGPCMAEFEEIPAAIIAPFANKDFVLLPVSRGETREKVAAKMEELKKKGIDFNVAIDPNKAIWNKYASIYIPKNFLIDRNGVIRFVSTGAGEDKMQQLVEAIKNLLRE